MTAVELQNLNESRCWECDQESFFLRPALCQLCLDQTQAWQTNCWPHIYWSPFSFPFPFRYLFLPWIPSLHYIIDVQWMFHKILHLLVATIIQPVVVYHVEACVPFLRYCGPLFCFLCKCCWLNENFACSCFWETVLVFKLNLGRSWEIFTRCRRNVSGMSNQGGDLKWQIERASLF